ncbi:MAG: trypsin-like peptidase domain-containing protein [Oscillospiraceae bacterium]|nr:trypsin-like peptidase domain-containing protein [Oscillospiraceae bacterium]
MNDKAESDRVNGEYHYSNGYTERIYSDAHYVRADESTTPPRYYTPPEKAARQSREEKSQKGVGAGALIACCLVCAMLGGLGGAFLTGRVMDQKVSALEQSVDELSESVRQPTVIKQSTAGSAGSVTAAGAAYNGAMSAGDLYDMACEQVVGVTTEVTYMNYFGMRSSAAVSGTGFIITADGYILTNYHVIEDAYKAGLDVNVMMHDGTRYPAQIVGVEADNDVAVLKIDATGLNAATLGNSDNLRVGDTVYAVGNPLGELEFSMTTGHVSAKDRSIVTEAAGDSITMFQIDAAVNSGNSGGPVYNARGEVVGIVTAKYRSSGVEGIGFAIPISDAVSIAQDLVTSGYVTGKAHLGVSVNSKYNEMYAQYYGWPVGAYIDSVDSGSSAENAGIQPGDIITAIDGDSIRSYDDLRASVKRHTAGETVDVALYRADENHTVTVTFDEERPA